jgi:hypothetical protein
MSAAAERVPLSIMRLLENNNDFVDFFEEPDSKDFLLSHD